MSIATTADLLKALRDSSLLTPAQLHEIDRGQRSHLADPHALAKELVQRGWLTAYQGNQLLQGRVKELILEPYVLLERLGEGGMGQVFKARHQKLGRTVAIKIIRKERLDHPDAVRRFHREIRAAAQLDHPNIVHAYDADEVNGTHFFAMEYVEGIDLAKLVKQRGPLPVREACEYIRQAALGLQHAHERGMVHRDIKPGNLLVTRPSRDREGAVPGRLAGLEPLPHGRGSEVAVVKLLDLGLARLHAPGEDAGESASALTHQGTVMGTPDYIAPEQAISSHTVDIRADLYSLGCTLFFLLTGRPPFVGGTMMERLMKHQVEKPPSVESLRPDVPPEVAAVVHKLLAKRPDERYPIPAELAAALQAVIENMDRAQMIVSVGGQSTSSASAVLEPTMALTGEPTPPVARSAPLAVSPGRGKLIVASVVSGVICLGLVLLVWWPFGRGKPPEVAASRPASITPAPRPSRPLTPEEAAKLAEQKRVAEAEEALKPLEAKFKEPGVRFETFAKEVQAFKATHGGTPAAIKAAELLMKLPSPLDQLDPAKIPEDAKAVWKASGFDGKDVVAVLGEHRQRHWGSVRCLSYSRDGKLIASGGEDSVIRLWDAETLRERVMLKGHTGTVTSLAFSRDGKHLLSGSSDTTARLWEVATGQQLRSTASHGNQVFCVAFSPGGRRFLTGAQDNPLLLWDVDTMKVVRRLEGHKSWVHAAAFSADGRRILSIGLPPDNTIRIWNVETGQELRRFEGKQGQSIALAPNGKQLLVDSRLLDSESGTELRGFPGYKARFSPDGQRILTYAATKLWLFDAESGKELHSFQANADVHDVAFTLDGKRAVSGGDDGTVRLWALDTGKEVQPLTGPVGGLNTVLFFPNDQLLTAGGDGQALLWDAVSVKTFGHYHAVQAWDVPEGPPACRYLGLGTDAVLRSYNANGEKQHDMGKAAAVSISADRCRVLLVDPDGTGRIWEPQMPKELGRIEVPGRPFLAKFLALSADGRRALTADGNTVRLWDAQRSKQLLQFDAVARSDHGSLSFAPDGRSSIIGSGELVSLFRLDTGELVRRFEGNKQPVTHVAISADGSTVVSSALDGRVVQWNIATGAKLHEWQLPGPVHAVAFANDGRHLATANGNGTVYVFRVAPPPPDPVTAEKTWKELQATVDAAVTGELTPAARLAALREDVVKFRTKYAGLPQYTLRAAELLAKLPSPLDQLDPAKIPEDAKAAWRAGGRGPPVELVGVLGEHRGRHWGPVNCVAYSPDGQFVASCGQENRVYLRDAVSLEPVAVLKGHTAEVMRLLFTPDGHFLISAGRHPENMIRIWEVATRREVKSIQANAATTLSLAVSKNGKRLLSGHHDGVISLWDLVSGKELRRLEGHKESVNTLAFLTDGRLAISGSGSSAGRQDWTLRLWDVETGKELKRMDYPHLVASAVPSADGRLCLVGSHDRKVRVWDLERGEEIKCLNPSEPSGIVNSVAFLPGERQALAAHGDAKTLRLWDLESGKELKRFEGHSDIVLTVSVDPKGVRAISGSRDGTVRLWDVETGKEVQPLTGHNGAIFGVAFSPDCRYVLSGGQDKTLRLWDMATGKERRLSAGDSGVIRSAGFSPDGRHTFSGSDDGFVRLKDTETDKELMRFEGRTQPEPFGVTAVAQSPDGKLFASAVGHLGNANAPGAVKLWELTGGPETAPSVKELASVPDASGFYAVAFSADSNLLALGGSDKTVRLLDVKTKPLRELGVLRGHGASVYAVAFDPRAPRLASGSADGTVRLWDVSLNSPQQLLSLGSHTHTVHSVAFAADGKTLASAGYDGRIILWEPASGKKLREWQLPGPVHGLAFAADGRHLATANGNGTVYILRLAPKELPPE